MEAVLSESAAACILAEGSTAPKQKQRVVIDLEGDGLAPRRSRRIVAIAAGGDNAATLLTFAASNKESSINSWA